MCVAELAVRLALLLGLLATIGLLMAIVALQCKLLAARSSEQQKARESLFPPSASRAWMLVCPNMESSSG